MTGNTPMTGRDTGAAFRGLVVGFVAIAAIVLVIVALTNKKFEGHGETPAAEATH
jgi:hypothetical protein